MKVLLVSEYYPPKVFGGGEISAKLIAEGLCKQGIDVHVLTSKIRYPLKTNGIILHSTLGVMRSGDNPYDFKANLERAFIFPRSLVKEIRQYDEIYDFDVIHLLNTNSIFGAGAVNKPTIAHINSLNVFCPKGTFYCNKPCSFNRFINCKYGKGVSKVKGSILTKYNPVFLGYVYYRFWSRRKKLNDVAHFIAISKYLKRIMENENKNFSNKTSVVYNPIELEKFNIMKTKNRIPKILFMGSFEKFKGVDVLLKALTLVKHECEAHFYGVGSENPLLNAQFHGVKNVHVHAVVPYNRVPEVYAKHDIVVFPSRWNEPFGRVIIEAMASGTPVIATGVGAVPELINHGINGFIVPNEDSQTMANYMDLLLIDEKFRKRIGENGRNSVERFSVDNIGKEIKKIYNKAIKNETNS